MKSFDEWLDTTKLRGYMDENSLEAAYEAGQQSKQAEVDELKRELRFKDASIKNLKLQFKNKQIDCDISDREVDELQKRIDEALQFLTRTDITSINIARDILKGDSYES